MTTAPPSLRLFGTDGIRAPFGTFPLDEQTVGRIGYHLGLMLGEERLPIEPGVVPASA